ncbi:hypothetical protein GIB67_028763 [Kingdonia uniflora]|uniref:Uncharacterized protein n=1 Tax=Kingdonia uniflora TaxID=39325 RepID=A0A7J7M232_9MAGN|nr:hypothetical protein GIB67_028763 [Kingdonia uniflora]
MATMQKPQKSLAEYEDIVIRKIFLVSLVDSNDVRVVYLEQAAAEILASEEPPFLYLVSSYHRAYEEGKKMGSMRRR